MNRHITDEEILKAVPKVGSVTPAQVNRSCNSCAHFRFCQTRIEAISDRFGEIGLDCDRFYLQVSKN